MKKVVFVGMSGGVDSSVTAALLKERGFNVHGVHIKMWSDPSIPCRFKEDRYDAMSVAEHLGIPFETWDFTEEYKTAVVEYLIREYAANRTPNPDVMCNRKVKFGIFLQKALERGADYVATGHYVRKLVVGSEVASSEKLQTARDSAKDQSYFLWTLRQDQLKHALFPIGEFTKPEVREIAKDFGLSTAQKPDSQGICFIGEIDIKAFLKQHVPAAEGAIVTTSGKVIGTHDGTPFYTIGQREGLGIGGGIPYYVARKDMQTNTLTVAEGPYDEVLFSSELVADDINWISGHGPELPLECKARIRYRQPLQDAHVYRGNVPGTVRVVFAAAQRAVTPGQSIVFYSKEGDGNDGTVMLGGGCIQ